MFARVKKKTQKFFYEFNGRILRILLTGSLISDFLTDTRAMHVNRVLGMGDIDLTNNINDDMKMVTFSTFLVFDVTC